MEDRHPGTIVIGGGQAGLAVGYHLKRRRLPFVILDENDRIGDAWRKRWDSLRLFTPCRYDGLPGRRFPGPASSYPTKDEMAAYLEAYARAFELPVRTGTRVDKLLRVGDGFEVLSGGRALPAGNVVVATGAYHKPRIPPFAHELDEKILQLHSREYRSPSQIPPGGVLVVGAGNSGAEIALDLASRHRIWLSGRDTGQEPAAAGTRAHRLFARVMWFLATRVLTVATPFGRKVRDHFLDPPRGIPLGRVRRKDFARAGVERVPRVAATRGGAPVLDDGTVLTEIATVVWCTGFVPDYDWIDIPLPDHNGVPLHDRGVVTSCPGLYLMGLPFLYSLSSVLVGGVGRDAAHIVDHIAASRAPRVDSAALSPDRSP